MTIDTAFWRHRWETNDIGFHEKEPNPSLTKHFEKLGVKANSRIFLPLCGKTVDIAWFLSEGHHIIGVELIELAITQLFDDLRIKPKISRYGKFKHYQAQNIDIFVGDIFHLNSEMLKKIDAVYDRAALVALPEETRNRYTAHLTTITDHAPQLLLTFEYDQNLMEGPPFSVSNEEVARHYNKSYNLTLLATQNFPGGLKGKLPAKENVWLVRKK